MKLFKTNQNKSERKLRLIISLFLIPNPLFNGLNPYSTVLLVIGVILFFNAVTGTCYTYRLFGINTCDLDNWIYLLII